MSEIEELVTLREIKKPGSDSFQTDQRASRQEVGADAGGWLFGWLPAGTVLHCALTCWRVKSMRPYSNSIAARRLTIAADRWQCSTLQFPSVVIFLGLCSS